MGLIDFVKGGIRELAIARPDANKGALVYKHPDPTIPNKAQLTVGTDEVALFFKDGQFIGQVGPGRHTLETSNIMFLNRLIDKFTGGDVFRAEVWFVTTREVAGFKFGGRIGDVEDPKSGLAIGTMVHGEFSIQATDPTQVIQFFGQRSWAHDDEFSGWFRQQLLKTIRDRIAQLLVVKKLPLLDVTSGALTEEIEAEVLQAVNQTHLQSYGMRIARLGNFVVSIKEEDEQTLKQMYKDAAQLKMASNHAGNLAAFQQFAAGKAMMSAGEGMARGGGGGENPMLTGAGLGMGMGMANMFSQMNQPHASQQAAQAAPPPAGPTLEERLKKLKSLKDAGLIDDAEYMAKRAEILKDI